MHGETPPIPSVRPGTEGFQSLPPEAEGRSGTSLLVAAYVVLWVILLGFVMYVWRKQTRVAKRMDAIDAALDRLAASQDEKSR